MERRGGALRGDGGARGALVGNLVGNLVGTSSGVISGATSGRGARVVPPIYRIDLSTAPVEELALLPEVGPLLAARIAADRAIHGPFRSVDELTRVPGFGERRIAELRDVARASAP